VGVATHLALGLALRREEVLGLEHEFVDYETGMIDIVQTLTYASGELHFGPPKSEAGRRTLVAPPFVLDALKRHRAMQAGRRLLYGTDWNDHGLVVDFATGVRGCRRRSRRTGADGLVATAAAMSRSTD
jgi:integrase